MLLLVEQLLQLLLGGRLLLLEIAHLLDELLHQLGPRRRGPRQPSAVGRSAVELHEVDGVGGAELRL